MRPADDRAAREFDLIVWGATGYTGGLVARAVAERAPADLRWAVSGRDRERLDAVRNGIGRHVDRIRADAHDAASLDAMVRRTRTVVSTVGPYARHGTPLVAACVAAGTDYADISGEVSWMRSTIDAFHAGAGASGTRIAHACGFDAVPSDLGVQRLQAVALERHGRPCRDVLHLFGPMSGGVSGGTVASSLALLESAADDPGGVRSALADPDLLAPGAARSPREPDPWWPQRRRGAGGWTAPFALAAVNEKVVRRTRALLGEPWGNDFRYRERLGTATWARAAAVGAATVAAPRLLAFPPVRRAARWLLPSPGEGPGVRARERGFFRSTLIGRVDPSTEPVLVTVAFDLDPGYGATARMLAETGLGLALDEFDAPGGVLTPAVLGGARLLRRLGEVGIRVQVQPPSARDVAPTRLPQ